MTASLRLALSALALLVFVPRTAAAQEPLSDFQTWTQVQASVKLDSVTEGLKLTLEGTLRRGSPTQQDDGQLVQGSMSALFVRPVVEYVVNEHVTVGLGYAYTPVFFDDVALRDHNVGEHRVFEQLVLKGKLGLLGYGTRTRLEQRIRTQGKGDGDVGVRWRQRFRAAVAFSEESPFSFVVSDELLFFLNNTGFSVGGFSENRGFAGFGVRGGEHLSFEVGYLNQFAAGRGKTHRMNHALSTSAKITL